MKKDKLNQDILSNVRNKYFLYSIFIFYLFITCKSNKDLLIEPSKERNQISLLENKSDFIIYGKYLVIESIIDGISEKCNKCPYIEFFKNGKGKFILPSNEEFIFVWSSSQEKIHLSLIENEESKGHLFFNNEKEFNYEIIEKEKIFLLKLVSIKSSNKYILSNVVP